MRALITGGSGFVGPFLSNELKLRSHEAVVLDHTCDLTNYEDTTHNIAEFINLSPDKDNLAVFHLAALSHVGMSWDNPARYVEVNVQGTVNLLKALADIGFTGRFIFVSSAEVYGKTLNRTPIVENVKAAPLSPYAASKLAGEEFVLQYQRAYGYEGIIARPFNHIGPNQTDKFLVSAIAKRIVEAELAQHNSIDVGNLDAVRDFLDVRDVVRAYVDIAEYGENAQVYNICSGVPTTVRTLVDELISLSGAELHLSVNPSLVRPIEVEYLVGDNSKLVTRANFTQKYTLSSTLEDVLKFWRGRVESPKLLFGDHSSRP